MNKKIMISISGLSGCGNSTVCNMLAKRFNLYLLNYTLRDMAKKKNITLELLQKQALKDDNIDKELDSLIKRKAKEYPKDEYNGIIIGSRLAIWLFREESDLKIYLKANLESRTQRIANRENKEFEISLKETKERDRENRERYKKIYNIDTNNYNFTDLIIDAENNDASKVFLKIEKEIIKIFN